MKPFLKVTQDQAPVQTASGRGFTLIELLVVLAIIGLVAAISLPALKGIGRANVMASARRQMLDDLAYARQVAIKDRTTVHVVFLPPEMFNADLSMVRTEDKKQAEDLRTGGYRTYAIFAERSAGDQPGRARSRYVKDWNSLPDGVLLVTNQFDDLRNPTVLWGKLPLERPFEYVKLPFPSEEGPLFSLPHIAFDPHGRLTYSSAGGYHDTYVRFSRGSVLTARDNNGTLLGSDLDVRENPEDAAPSTINRIRLDGFTGKGQLEDAKIP